MSTPLSSCKRGITYTFLMKEGDVDMCYVNTHNPPMCRLHVIDTLSLGIKGNAIYEECVDPIGAEEVWIWTYRPILR